MVKKFNTNVSIFPENIITNFGAKKKKCVATPEQDYTTIHSRILTNFSAKIKLVCHRN